MHTVTHTSQYDNTLYQLGIGFGEYTNGQTRIQLYDLEDGLPYCTATISVEQKLSEGEVAIKNYSENVGILQSLVSAGVIEKPHSFIETGYVTIPLCKLKVSLTTGA